MLATGVVDERGGRAEFAAEAARREREVVFVTADARGAEALRGWGLLAVARPEEGDWERAVLGVLVGRDVVVVDYGQAADPARAERDVQVLAGVARRAGVLAPGDSPRHGTTRDLQEYVRRQQTLGVGPQVLVSEALARLRSEAPAPRPEAGEPEAEWPPLRLGDLPPVEPFPLDALPESVAGFLGAAAHHAGAPVDYAAVSALVAAGAAIGRSAALILRPGECVLSVLHALNVGEAQSGKTRAMRAVIQPLRDLKRGVVAEGSGTFASGDAAQEARGVLVVREDATEWVSGLLARRRFEGNPYADFWHQAVFDAPGGAGRTPFLSFCGALRAGTLALFGTPGHGRRGGQRNRHELLDRLLFALPDPVPHAHWSDEGVPDASARAWSDALGRLRDRASLNPYCDPPEPHPVALTEDAKEAWVAWYNARSDELNAPGCDPAQRAAEAPLRETTARLALIVHLLHVACDPAQGPADPLPRLKVDSLRKALRLWSYFRAQHRRVRWVVAGGADEPVAGAIVDWIKRTGRACFSLSELTSALRWLPTWPDQPAAALRALEERHALRRRSDPARPAKSPGRKHSPTYDVHPALVAPGAPNARAADLSGGDFS